MNEINFCGGFLIEKPSIRMWNGIQENMPKKKCVFQNFNENGDKFFVIKSVYDKAMASYILSKNVKFKFYPEINLKNRLDPYSPEEAHRVISAQTYVIDSKSMLRKFINANTDVNIVPKYKWKPNDHIGKTLKALELNPDECNVKIISGVAYITDKKGIIIAKASPNNERGVNFVYVYPKHRGFLSNKDKKGYFYPQNTDDSPQRFALTQGGERHYFGALQTIDFQNKFKQNVKIDSGRIRPKQKQKAE